MSLAKSQRRSEVKRDGSISCARSFISCMKSRMAVLIQRRIFAGPVVFVAQAPHDHTGVIEVLVDHVGEHEARLVLPFFVAYAGAAPRRFFPNQNAKLVAEIEHQFRLLIMAEADEVRAHRLDQLHLGADERVRLGGREAGMVHVALRAAQQQALAVQLEGSVVNELRVADAETLVHDAIAVGSGKSDAAV